MRERLVYFPEDKFEFGKNFGYTLKYVFKYQPLYIEWLVLSTNSFIISIDRFNELPNPTPLFYADIEAYWKYKTSEDLLKRASTSSVFLEDAKHNVKDIVDYKNTNDIALKEIEYKIPKIVVDTNQAKFDRYTGKIDIPF